MNTPLPPPVPQALFDMLKEHPEHLQILQNDLISVAKKKSSTPAFERAIWALEDAMSSFVSEARKELKAAQDTGDEKAIAEADAKERLMSRASWKHVWLNDEALWEYFQKNNGAVQ